jgi:hypothetical protein
VDTESKFGAGIGHLCWISEDVYRQPTNWWEEELDVVACDEFGIRATGLLEQGPPENALILVIVSCVLLEVSHVLTNVEAFSDTR